MKLLFTTCFLSPYRTDFFNELGKYADVVVLAEENSSRQNHRNQAWFSDQVTGFTLVNLNLPREHKRAKGTLIWNYVKEYHIDIVVIGGYSTNTEIMNLLTARFHKVKVLLNFDGVSPDGGSRNRVKDAVKKILIRAADGYLISGLQTERFLERYGVPRQKMYAYPFTSIRQEDLPARPLSPGEKAGLREELGMEETGIILSVGRFIDSKGFDLLLRAARRFDQNVGVYIIGDRPGETYLKLAEQVRDARIHFGEFKPRKELWKYYQAADVFVLPTRSDVWGLVVNEAMANGLPVVTTDRCIAGMELIEDWENGFIVPVDSEAILAERMEAILGDPSLAQRMSVNNLEKIGRYTIENMAEQHVQIMERLMKDKE